MDSVGVSNHDSCHLLLKCKAESAVNLFTNCRVGGGGRGNDLVRDSLVNSTPFAKRYNSEYIGVQLNKILSVRVKELRKQREM